METNPSLRKVTTCPPAGRDASLGVLLMLVLVACGLLRAAEKTPTSAPLFGRIEHFTRIETLPVGAYEVV